MKRSHRVLPGFGLSLGITLLYLSILVLIPLSLLFWNAGGGGWEHFKSAAFSPRALASYKITFGASFVAATINLFAGMLIAWVLVRYRFPGRSFMDALVDLPFALPTAVGGIALTTAYAPNGFIGRQFAPDGIIGRHFGPEGLKLAYTPIGIVIALTFISLPFVVRTVQPVLGGLDAQLEEAASSLGANRFQTFRRVIFPYIWPALLTGWTLGFARALGEYGSVVFIAGNQPLKTEIVPLLIITRLEEYDYPGATALAVVMLTASFSLLLAINTLSRWTNRRASA
ncbi:sulfate transport system permease protein CysT [Abditibacteriota bacterium]|nr:sulfate transport system permease protein CysT [Abditibacteriota bacterium]